MKRIKNSPVIIGQPVNFGRHFGAAGSSSKKLFPVIFGGIRGWLEKRKFQKSEKNIKIRFRGWSRKEVERFRNERMKEGKMYNL